MEIQSRGRAESHRVEIHTLGNPNTYGQVDSREVAQTSTGIIRIGTRDNDVALRARSTSINGRVADVGAGHHIDDVLGDIGGMVGDALEIFRDEDKFESGENDRRIFHHVSEQFAKHLVAQTIDIVVAREHAFGQGLIVVRCV